MKKNPSASGLNDLKNSLQNWLPIRKLSLNDLVF